MGALYFLLITVLPVLPHCLTYNKHFICISNEFLTFLENVSQAQILEWGGKNIRVSGKKKDIWSKRFLLNVRMQVYVCVCIYVFLFQSVSIIYLSACLSSISIIYLSSKEALSLEDLGLQIWEAGPRRLTVELQLTVSLFKNLLLWFKTCPILHYLQNQSLCSMVFCKDSIFWKWF